MWYNYEVYNSSIGESLKLETVMSSTKGMEWSRRQRWLHNEVIHMLQLYIGRNWRVGRETILAHLAEDVKQGLPGRILLVPEQASHDYERRLCQAAGDSASRYAEVLSFTRLASRVFSQTGGGAEATLDKGGRLLAMAAAVWQLRPQLKSYAAAVNKPEFLTALVTAVDEFKTCLITPEVLKTASQNTEGALAQKLEELALLLEGYEGICAQFGQDPRDRMTRLLEELEDSDFAQTHVFYIDGFSDFTAQELAIVEHLMAESQRVTVNLVCDQVRSDTPGFELAGETASQLIHLSKGENQVLLLPDPEESEPLGKLRAQLLAGEPSQIPELEQNAQAVRLGSNREECVYAALELRKLASQGIRYRDMAVVCSNLQGYGPVLRQVLGEYGIPAYFAGNEDILHKSAVYTVMTALEAATEGLETGLVLRYLKSMLSPLEPEQCDRLENYAIIWGIRGAAWTKPFEKHPEGLGKPWQERDKEALAMLEESRQRGVGPLWELEKALKQAKTVLEQLQGLYTFLETVELPQHLEALAEHFEAREDRRSAQEQEQLWGILVGAMEQMAGLLGSMQMEPEVFVRLLRLLLSQYDVGTIPQTLDSVTVGDVSSMRRHEGKHLILLGAQEGFLPQGGSGGMVLTEPERHRLMDLGVPLKQDLYRQIQQELAGIYAVATAAKEHLTLTCSQGQPAYVYQRLCRALRKDPESVTVLPEEETIPDAWAAGAVLVRQSQTEPGPFQEQWQELRKNAAYTPGKLSPKTVRGLYGKELTLSASQVDKAATCKFAYFMRYGLKAQLRKEIEVDPAEFGTFVHYVLENAAREVCAQGGFRAVSLEQTRQLAQNYAMEYQKEHFSQLGDQPARQEYLFRRNLQELDAVVEELWQELRQSRFVPGGFEVKFGRDGAMAPVEIPGGILPARIQGFVDRLDVYSRGDKTYVRVVDYKTGKKNFDYCDVLNGIGLQMLIYLFALEDVGEELLGDQPEAAGVLYFPARASILSVSGPMSPDEMQKERRKEQKRKGLVLEEESILMAMDETEEFRFLPVKQKKGGKLEGDLANVHQLRELKEYVKDCLSKLVNQIAEGSIEPNPYIRGQNSPCNYCDYKGACHLDLWGAPREFKEIKSEEFWQEVEKHGR